MFAGWTPRVHDRGRGEPRTVREEARVTSPDARPAVSRHTQRFPTGARTSRASARVAACMSTRRASCARWSRSASCSSSGRGASARPAGCRCRRAATTATRRTTSSGVRRPGHLPAADPEPRPPRGGALQLLRLRQRPGQRLCREVAAVDAGSNRWDGVRPQRSKPLTVRGRLVKDSLRVRFRQFRDQVDLKLCGRLVSLTIHGNDGNRG